MRSVFAAALLCVAAPVAALAGPIDQACMRSGKGVNSELCSCIQQVANMTLNGSDQKLAAKFFADPHKAQEVRQSSQSGNRAFWQRYSSFGTTAESICSQRG